MKAETYAVAAPSARPRKGLTSSAGLRALVRSKGATRVLVTALAAGCAGLAAGYFAGYGLVDAARGELGLAATRTQDERARASKDLETLRALLAEQRARLEEQAQDRTFMQHRLLDEIVALRTRQQARETEWRDTLAALRDRDAQTRADLAALRADLAGIATRGPGAGPFAGFAKQYQDGLFLVVLRTSEGQLVPLGTAFAIRADGILGTNAHVGRSLEDLLRRLQRLGSPAVALAIMNRHPERALRIVRWRVHPGHDPQKTHSVDACLLEVATGGAPLPVVLPLATQLELTELAAGQPIGLLGFPGEVTDPANPIATFERGDVGRITTLDGTRGPRAKELLVQHSAPAARGSSGSPIISEAGRVVAIHTSGLEIQFLAEQREISLRPSGIHWGLRADVLLEMLATE